ncbi:MAG: hypothetical protein ABIQ49_15610 [Gemmatimonadales bacterium]
MTARLPPTLRTLARAFVILALPLLPLAAPPAAAQRQQPAASADAGDYQLTMPMLRKALPVLNAPGAKTECAQKKDEHRDMRTMSAALMQKFLDDCPPVRRAAAAQGISIFQLAQVYKAITQAGYRITEEEGAKVSGGTPRPLPPGALRDNVALVRQNEAELARLFRGSN